MPVLKTYNNGKWEAIAGAARHTHKTNDITDFPSSLPANGGNAETLDGKYASDFASASEVENLKEQVTDFETDLDTVKTRNAFSSIWTANGSVSADSPSATLDFRGLNGITVKAQNNIGDLEVVISNSGVRSISTGSTNGTISVNTNGTSADVAVKGLGSAAYTSSSVDMVFDTFPSTDVVNGMNNWATFKTHGYYNKLDGFGCTYIVRNTKSNLYIPYGNMFIRAAFVDENVRDIKPEWYGIRRGDSSTTYAEENSAIMDKLAAVLQNGYTLSFGSGHYYFARPFILAKYTMIKGACTNAQVADSAVNYGTYLHFSSVTDGDAAIALNAGGVVQDIGIVGNPSVCNVTLDRAKTITDPNSVINLVEVGTTYGIKTGGSFTIQNVRLRNFTYGIYAPAGNDVISHVDIRQCKVGISVGNDVKISNVQVWNVMTGIELRGSLASATNVRGDSIGKHLIECQKGKCLLTNIDGDYCVGSLIHYGGGASFIHLGQAVACMGRVATKYAHSRSSTFDLQAIASGDYEYCSFISIAPNTKVFGGYIDVVNVKSNVFDADEYNYVTPSSVISIGTGSTVKSLIIKCTVPSDADNDYFNKNVIKNLSNHAESANDNYNYVTDFDGKTIEDICFITPFGMAVSKRTVDAPNRQVEMPRVLMDMLDTVEVLTPGINLNDGVWEAGYLATDGTNTGHTGTYATQSFRNANYIPVEGGRKIAIYYDAYAWNNNNIGKNFYLCQYDANKNIVGQRVEIVNYRRGTANVYTLDASTAFIRVAFHNWAELNTALTDVKAAIYYQEDAVQAFVEYGYDSSTTHKIKGDAIVLKSPNGTAYILSVSDSGALSTTSMNPV